MSIYKTQSSLEILLSFPPIKITDLEGTHLSDMRDNHLAINSQLDMLSNNSKNMRLGLITENGVISIESVQMENLERERMMLKMKAKNHLDEVEIINNSIERLYQITRSSEGMELSSQLRSYIL